MNCAATGNSLRKSSGRDGVMDAGARLQQMIASDDGYVEFTVTEANKTRYCGLTRNEATIDSADMDFAIKLTAGGVAEVRENNDYAVETSYRSGDRFRIAIEGRAVKYYKNDRLFFTNLKQSAHPLYIVATFVNLNAAISYVVISTAPTRP